MIKDPLHRAIEERLAERPDPDLFERCAVDLLRDVYPGLVPIPGGGDAGMDGAMSVPGGGHPIPLVATTRKDVIGNLTNNLKSYRSTGGSAREAVLATSQALTPQKRRNLEQRADELGFVLRNVHEQADFVGRLYRNPVWRKDLLRLTGDPPALSAFPRSPRPWPAQQVLGRDDELAWLRRARQDVVISGQPGVGKTALLRILADEGFGLFAVSEDLGQIADACRELDPDWVFVDDAHLDAATPRDSLLGGLARLRHELDMSFRIMATTWPGHEDDVRHTLYVARDTILRVKPLERSTVADIVRGVNTRFTDVLIGEIIDQSDGRPGLAVTLAQWAQRDELRDLVNGQLLLREIRKDLRRDRTLDALAPFALAGGFGMRLPSAAKALTWPEGAVREALRLVSGTGILRETDDDDPYRSFIRVEPKALRVALVERGYFSGALSMALAPALEQVEDPASCTYTLIQVLARGVSVPHELIRDRLERLHRSSVWDSLWAHYVETGEKAARWVLHAHPDKTVSVGRAALRVVPDLALDRLVNSCESNLGTDDPTQAIKAWVRSGLPGRDAVERRISVIQQLAASFGSPEWEQNKWRTQWRSSLPDLFRVAFSLSMTGSHVDPLDDGRIVIASGSLSGAEVRALAREWPTVIEALRNFEEKGIHCARQILERWTGRLLIAGQHPETNTAAEREAPRMLQDVVEMADQAPGVVMWARRLARFRKLAADLPDLDDPLLVKLFPGTETPRSRVAIDDIMTAARSLATEWDGEDPEAVVGRMIYYERQRELAGHIFPDVLRYVPDALGERVHAPLKWLAALLDQGAPARWVYPLLEGAVAAAPNSGKSWEMVAREARYDQVTIRVGLGLARPPEHAVGHILEAVRRGIASHRDLDVWDNLSRAWQCRLLQDSDDRVRAVAAVALWRVHRGQLPAGALGTLLRDAVVESGDTALLQELLGRDRVMARSWILQQARIFSTQQSGSQVPPVWPVVELPVANKVVLLGDVFPGQYTDLLKTAVTKLTIEDRRDLILAIPAHSDERFFSCLVDADPDLYRVLLNRNVPKPAHMEPLLGQPSERLDPLIRMAREHGYTDCAFDSPIGQA